MDSGEMVLGIGQLASTIILGLMAVKYSKRVAKIEHERKEVEARKEKVELLNIINILRSDIILFSTFLRRYPSNKETNENLSLEKFLKIIDDFKKIKFDNGSLLDEEVVQMAFSKNIPNEKYEDIHDLTEKSKEILLQDRELFKRCVFLIDILEIRDDISDSQSITSKIKEDLNNPSFDYSESPLLYAVKAHIHFKLISDSLDKVRTSIINS